MICHAYTSVANTSTAAVPHVASVLITVTDTSQALGVTSTWSGGRGSGMQAIQKGENGRSIPEGDARENSFPYGRRVTDAAVARCHVGDAGWDAAGRESVRDRQDYRMGW